MSTEENFHLRPKQNPTAGRVLKRFAYLAGLATFALMLAVTLFAITLATVSTHADWTNAVRFGLFLALGFIVFVAGKAFGYFNRWGRRHLAPFGEDVFARDPRTPMLYLRSFADDKTVYREEEEFAKVLETWGPVVAVGTPGEALPPLGASRFYVAHSEWQAFVSNLLGKSRLVFILAGDTPGLSWELQECRALIAPQHLIVIVPRDQEAYEAFRAEAEAATDLKLPEYPLSSLSTQPAFERHGCRWLGLITFDADWVASYVAMRVPEGKEYLSYEEFGPEFAWKARFRNALHPIISGAGLTSAPLPPSPGGRWMRLFRFFAGILVVAAILWLLIQAIGH